ncbi:Uncharacterised protein [Enterobacter hormaechei]|nr:Uncharacterised protein [Enterobacter hormaechei]
MRADLDYFRWRSHFFSLRQVQRIVKSGAGILQPVLQVIVVPVGFVIARRKRHAAINSGSCFLSGLSTRIGLIRLDIVVGDNNDMRLRILLAHHLGYGQQVTGVNGDHRQRIRAHQMSRQDGC